MSNFEDIVQKVRKQEETNLIVQIFELIDLVKNTFSFWVDCDFTIYIPNFFMYFRLSSQEFQKTFENQHGCNCNSLHNLFN